MADYSIHYINRRSRLEPERFIQDSEERYRQQVISVAEQIACTSKEKPIVLLNGPSSSGKTTTNERLQRALEKHGIHAETISMDDYYRTLGSYEIPKDLDNQVPDLESPECMNLPLLSDHLSRLAAGEEITVPRFDFETRTFLPNARTLRLDTDEVALIEGIHSFNPLIMGDLANDATGVYLSVASSIVLAEGQKVEPTMLRFLRRAMRDSLFRNSPVSETLHQWNSVCRGERLYIRPNMGSADRIIDSYLPYESCILIQKLSDQLKTEKDALIAANLRPIYDLIDEIMQIEYEKYIPEDSVLHEFIG